MISNPTQLTRIQTLTQKIKAVDRPSADTHETRIQGIAHSFRQRTQETSRQISDNTNLVNQLVDDRVEAEDKGQNLETIRQKITTENQKLQGLRINTLKKTRQFKRITLPASQEPITVNLGQLSLDRFSCKLQVASQQMRQISYLVRDTTNQEFDKLDSRIQQQYRQQQGRSQELQQCISALEGEMALGLESEEREFVSELQQHHRTLERIISDLSFRLCQ